MNGRKGLQGDPDEAEGADANGQQTESQGNGIAEAAAASEEGRVTITIREMTAADAAVWAHMRHTLWPFTTPAENRRDIENILAREGMAGFIALDEMGAPAGFAEVAVRPYANGCEETPVAFLEGIWVAPDFRRRGIGQRIIAHIGNFLSAMGYNELCSDALIDNTDSHDAHRSWGFTETDRVVYFRKPLP